MTKAREYKYEGDVLYLKCSQCGEWLTIDKYNKHKGQKFGVAAHCRTCRKKERADYYKVNKTYVHQKNKEYYIEHKDEILATNREYYAANKDRIKMSMKEYRCLNKDRIRMRRRTHYIDNKHEMMDRQRKYYENNKLQIRSKNLIAKHTHSKELGFSWDYFHRKARAYLDKLGLSIHTCPICGNEGNIVMHHPSYDSFDMRSVVVLCCNSCHHLIHNGVINCPEPINLLNLTK